MTDQRRQPRYLCSDLVTLHWQNGRQRRKAMVVLENISLDIAPGEFVSIVGASGCGKTTLMLSLLRLLPSAGQIVDGKVTTVGEMTTADVEAVKAQTGVEIDRRAVSLDEHIKTTGTHTVPTKLHNDVQFQITVEVTAE